MNVDKEDQNDWDALSPTEKAAYRAALAPIHPGEILKKDFLEPAKLSNRALAKAIGLSDMTVGRIVAGEHAITPKTALLLGKYFTVSPEFWLGLQNDYYVAMKTEELKTQQKQLTKELAAIKPY